MESAGASKKERHLHQSPRTESSVEKWPSDALQLPEVGLSLSKAAKVWWDAVGSPWCGCRTCALPADTIPAHGFLRCPIAPQHRPMQRLYLAHGFSMFQLYAVCLCLLRGSRHDTSFACTEATMTRELKLKQQQYSSAKVQVEQLIKKATGQLMVARGCRHVGRFVQEKTLAKHTDQLEHQESRLACEWQLDIAG